MLATLHTAEANLATNKNVTAWRTSAPTTDAPIVADDSADMFEVLRRLAAKYTAKATYLGQLALITTDPARVAGITRTAVRFAKAKESTEALIG
jgi:hypothetical protein